MEGEKYSPWMWEESQLPEDELHEDGAECVEERDGGGMDRRAADHGDEELDHDGKKVSGVGELVTGIGKQLDDDGKLVAGIAKQLGHDGNLVAGDGKQLPYDGNLVAGDGKNEDVDLSDPRFVGGLKYMRSGARRFQVRRLRRVARICLPLVQSVAQRIWMFFVRAWRRWGVQDVLLKLGRVHVQVEPNSTTSGECQSPAPAVTTIRRRAPAAMSNADMVIRVPNDSTCSGLAAAGKTQSPSPSAAYTNAAARHRNATATNAAARLREAMATNAAARSRNASAGDATARDATASYAPAASIDAMVGDAAATALYIAGQPQPASLPPASAGVAASTLGRLRVVAAASARVAASAPAGTAAAARKDVVPMLMLHIFFICTIVALLEHVFVV